MRSQLRYVTALVITAWLLGGCVVRSGVPTEKATTDFLPVYRSFFSGKDTYEKFYQRAGSVHSIPQKVAGAIVPHHLLVGSAFARFFAAMRSQQPSTVVIIGPNHFEVGKGSIVTADGRYDTPYGQAHIDEELSQSLLQSPLLALDRAPFVREHSISAEVAFIKKTWPHATIVPIILKSDVTQEQATELGKLLATKLTNDALVLASVDFSHYLPELAADFHDQTSEAAITTFDLGRVMKLEIDSPASIVSLLTYLRERGAEKIVYREHTNSASFTGHPEFPETTSHFFLAFASGARSQETAISALFMGDAIFGRTIEDRFTKDRGTMLDALAGTEDRFLYGSDISFLNLEGPITQQKPTRKTPISFAFHRSIALPLLKRLRVNIVSIANNHALDAGQQGIDDTLEALKDLSIGVVGSPSQPCFRTTIADATLSLCGFDDTNRRMDEAAAMKILQEERRNVDRLIVSIHWGIEGRSQHTPRQTEIARHCIDAGADAVIGHHPHVVQPMEVYKGVPIFYSLGNLLFDQEDPTLSSGLAVGLVFRAKETMVYLFPLQTTHGAPRLFDWKERQVFSAEYLAFLDRYRDQKLEGTLIIPRE